MGMEGDAETAGGGRVLILSDSAKFDENAKVEANAWPKPDYSGRYGLQGGSGGYIYLKTTNLL
jgi:hypothetical protein